MAADCWLSLTRERVSSLIRSPIRILRCFPEHGRVLRVAGGSQVWGLVRTGFFVQHRPDYSNQAKKGKQWFLGMRAQIGMDDASGLVHRVECTASNVLDVTQAHKSSIRSGCSSGSSAT